MGTYTDTILLENQERLEDIEDILYSDASDSTFVKVLKHKLEKCSMWLLLCMCQVCAIFIDFLLESSLSVLLANTQDVSESL